MILQQETQQTEKKSDFEKELPTAYEVELHFKYLINGQHVILLTNRNQLAYTSSNTAKSDRQQHRGIRICDGRTFGNKHSC